MTSDVHIGLELDDDGSAKKIEAAVNEIKEKLKEVNKEAKELRKSLKDIEAVKGSTILSKQGSSSSGVKSSASALESAQLSVMARQRGTAQLTGAAGRDFSNQAQGLGGLVRLYATFAANIFALGAAFRSLSASMDTANMVKGLDQLGAAVGRNLGGLSKRMVELSEGSISMAEAMKAVALTSSGGMSQKNIERLAVVAKTASIALGVAMPDAINRLSRGITKLEPELLDELGIMARIDPAVELYARQVGKAVSQLTIFERRQAFANAVLAEGEEKFGAIAGIAVNPFDKLLSSLKDIIQSGTQFVNFFLEPVVTWLASSPTALITIITTLSGVILKQALPAIGELRAGLASSAEAAKDVALARAKDASAALAVLDNTLSAASDKLEALTSTRGDQQISGLQALSKARKKDLVEESLLANILEKSIDKVTDADIKRLETMSSKLANRNLKEQSGIIKGITTAIVEQKKAQEDLVKVQTSNNKFLDNVKQGGRLTTLGQTEAIALKAQDSAIKKAIISNAAYNGSLLGLGASFKILKAEIESSTLELSKWEKTLLSGKAKVAAVGGVIGTFFRSIMPFMSNLIAIGATIGVIVSVLEHFFSGNAEEAKAFSGALDSADSSIENMNRTLAKLRKDGTQGTIVGIKALSEAFVGLANDIEQTVDTANKKLAANTSFDTFKNNFFRIFSSDIESKLSDKVVRLVTSALDAIGESNLKEQAEEEFRRLFDIDILDEAEIRASFERMGTTTQAALAKMIQQTNTTFGNSAARVDAFQVALDNTTLAYQQFIQTTSNASPVFRFGASLENLAITMHDIATASELSSEGINAVILAISKNPTAGTFLGDDFVNGLINIRKEYVEQEEAIISYKARVKELSDLIGKVPSNQLASASSLFSKEDLANEKKNITTLDKILKDRKALEERVTGLREKQDTSARTLFTNAVDASFKRGAELIKISLGQAAERGALAISRAALAGLSGEDRARAEAELSRREIEIRLREIDTNIQLILSQEKLIAALEHSTAVNDLARAEARGDSEDDLGILRQAEQAAKKFSEILSKGLSPTIEEARKIASNEDEARTIGVRGISVTQRMAEQDAAKTLAELEMRAAGLAGSIAINMGRVEDIQKLLGFSGQLTQSTSNRLAIVRQISALNIEETARAQGASDLDVLRLRQQSEILGIEAAITNAQSDSERKKQEALRTVMAERHEIELSTQSLQAQNLLITSRLDALARTAELARQISEQQFIETTARLDVANAEVSAYSQLFNITGEYAATQNEILGSQRAQVEFMRTASDVTINFMQSAESIGQRIAALDPVLDAAEISGLTTELERQEASAQSRIKSAKTQLTAQQAILKITKDTTNQQTRYNRLLGNASKITTNLSSSFGALGSSIGNLAESFSRLVVSASQGAGAIVKLKKEQEGLTQGTEAYADKEKEIAIQLNQNKMEQLSGYGQIAGAAKHMFEEQSAGYQILLNIERAFHIAHIAMAVARMVMDATTTTAEVANSGVRIGQATVEAEVQGVLAVVKAISSGGFPIGLIYGAITAVVVAGIIAAIGGKGPKSPKSSPSAGLTSQDVQDVQGTGETFINGKRTIRSGGILGASSEKSEDIANSLSLIEDHTDITSRFGQKTLDALKDIEKNTKDLAGSAFATTAIGKGKLSSGFGSVEDLTGSRRLEILDKGIIIKGTFEELIQGIGEFLEFETIQRTKKKSGVLGFGKSRKVSVEVLTKDLQDEAGGLIVSLFSGLLDVATISADRLFGEARTKILNNTKVDFKVSGLGLEGEELAEAIQQEAGIALNSLLETSFPVLAEFQQLGEGFTSTLVRMAATLDVGTSKLDSIGIDIIKEISDSFVGATAEELNIINIKVLDAIVSSFGGLEDFVEDTEVLFENFLSEEERLIIKTDQLNKAFISLGAEGVLTAEQVSTLTDGAGNLRMEYRNILLEQDRTTEAGIEYFAMLSKLGPAVVDVTDDLEDTIVSLKTLKESFRDSIGSLIEDASLGNLDTEAIGEDVATAIREGFLQALSSRFVDDITNSIVEQLITPVLNGALQMTTTGGFVLTASVNAIIDDMLVKANTLGELIKNPSFRQALSILSTSITNVVSTINENAKKMTFAFSKLKASELIEEIADLTKEIEERRLDDIIDAEQTRFDLLQKQADELEDTVTKFRDFSNSLRDFKQELLTGPLTPLTPLEQLDVAKKEFVRLFETASSANASDEDRLDALDKIQSSATTFLEASRLVFSSGPQFTEDFNFVQSVLDSLITTTGVKATIDEMQLDALKAQLLLSETLIDSAKDQKDLLSNIDNTLEAMLEKLDKLKKDLDDEYQVGTTQIADGFSILDKNFDGLLSLDELKSSGMASDDTLKLLLNRVDTDGDNQINRLEAIKGAAEGTQFTIQSTIPILDAINMGIITVAQGIAQIANMNSANTSSGGRPISGNVPAPTSGGVGIVGGNVTQSGAFIAADKVIGMNNLSTSVSDAKSAIMAMAAQVDAGTRTAMDMYNLFKSWGASSNTVGSLIGESGANVLAWLRMRDPNIPAFKDGINNVPRDMLAMIHEGERIFPKADNDSLMSNMRDSNNTNKEILAELQKMREELKKLQAIVIEGDDLNAAATAENASDISKAVMEAQTLKNHINNIERRLVKA